MLVDGRDVEVVVLTAAVLVVLGRLVDVLVVVAVAIVVLVVPVVMTTTAVSPLADQAPVLSRTQSWSVYVPDAV